MIYTGFLKIFKNRLCLLYKVAVNIIFKRVLLNFYQIGCEIFFIKFLKTVFAHFRQLSEVLQAQLPGNQQMQCVTRVYLLIFSLKKLTDL